MLSLLAAYGDGEEGNASPVPVKEKTVKKKSKSGVVKVTLPVFSTKKDVEDDVEKKPQRQQTGEKRSSIADLLPAPKSKQQKTSYTPSPAPEVISKSTKQVKEEIPAPTIPPASSYTTEKQETPTEDEEEEVVGPQMPCAADLVYYENYYEQAPETTQSDDVVSDMANCSHIPEVGTQIMISEAEILI